MARIVFFGTPEIASRTLEALIDAGHDIPLVITNPDKPANRGMKLSPSPVKKIAELNKIPLLQPTRLRNNPEIEQALKSAAAEFFVVVAYGKILTQKILDIPAKASLNIHYSLLPRHRGAAPVHYTLIHGDKESGVTIIQMNEGMDAGEILLVKKIAVEENHNLYTLTDKLIELGIEGIQEVLSDYDNLEKISQNHNEATYASKIDKSLGKINWNSSAVSIFNLYRALHPYPGIYFYFNDKKVTVTEVSTLAKAEESLITAGHSSSDIEVGRVVSISGGVIIVAAGEGFLKITKLKPESKKELNAKDFINGYGVTETSLFI